MTKKKCEIVFAIMWMLTLIFSVVHIAASIWWAGYLEQDIEHNYVTWLGVEYGVGMGSLSFVSNAMGGGVSMLIFCIMSAIAFPTWLKIRFD